MHTKNPEKRKRPIRSIAAATAVAAGALAYGAQEIDSTKDAQKASTETLNDIAADIESLKEISRRQQQQLDYLKGLNGLSQDDIDRHLDYPTIEQPSRPIDQAIVEKHLNSTLYILSASHEVTDPTTPLSYTCTAVKVDDTTLTSARHCFSDVNDFVPPVDNTGKGGGEFPRGDVYTSPIRYFATANPYLTLGEAEEQAVEIIGFGTDYSSGDSALLSVSPNEWFSTIEALPLKPLGPPVKGEAVHVAGYPNGSASPVTAHGTVLGNVLSSDIYNNGYVSDLLIVGITPESTEDFTCSFGASGSSIATADGFSYGALAQVSRSFTPEGSLDVIPDAQMILKLEEQLETQLAGSDYILCAYSPILPVEVKPLVPQSTIPPDQQLSGK